MCFLSLLPEWSGCLFEAFSLEWSIVCVGKEIIATKNCLPSDLTNWVQINWCQGIGRGQKKRTQSIWVYFCLWWSYLIKRLSSEDISSCAELLTVRRSLKDVSGSDCMLYITPDSPVHYPAWAAEGDESFLGLGPEADEQQAIVVLLFTDHENGNCQPLRWGWLGYQVNVVFKYVCNFSYTSLFKINFSLLESEQDLATGFWWLRIWWRWRQCVTRLWKHCCLLDHMLWEKPAAVWRSRPSSPTVTFTQEELRSYKQSNTEAFSPAAAEPSDDCSLDQHLD